MSAWARIRPLTAVSVLAVVEVVKVAAGWSWPPSWPQVALSSLVFGAVAALGLKKMPAERA